MVPVFECPVLGSLLNNLLNATFQADILTRYDAYLEEAKNEAMERFGADISQKIEDFKQKSIEPWRLENSCQKEAGTDSFLCDEQKIGGEIVNPGKNLKLLSNHLTRKTHSNSFPSSSIWQLLAIILNLKTSK